jgi:hypothetical protein
MRRLILLIVIALLSQPAWAHKPSDSYLSLAVQDNRINGQWDIALRDLNDAIGLDVDDDGAITWGEVRAKHREIASYALSRLTVTSDHAACLSQPLDHLVDSHTDGTYSVFLFRMTCAHPIGQIDADYRLLFDVDAQHRGLLRVTEGTTTQAAIFSPESPVQHFTIGVSSRWQQVRQYAREGVWHIWTGFDHLLFLLALLLPSVLIRQGTGWKGIARVQAALWEVAGIATAFTIAHSITLTLAALGVIALPSRLVESAIALSVAVAALGNLYPGLLRRRWMVAFGFGLIHGFGFAGVLADLGLPQGSLLLSLVSFNIGVEIGQLVCVGVFIPFAFLLRHSWTYPRLIVVPGSYAIAAMSLLWFLERAFDLKFSVL